MQLAPTTALWKHQIRMHAEQVEYLRTFGYSWLLAGCRTGKTLTALALAITLKVRRLLIITTAAAMRSAWPQEIADKTYGADVYAMIKGSSKEKAAKMKKFLAGEGTKIIVVNYETAALIADEIAAAGFDMVVADECQKLKSHDSKQSVLLARACAHIQYRMAMTGTPWDDRLSDVYGQVRWLSPLIKGKKTVYSEVLGTWGSFVWNYCETYKMGNVDIIKGYKNQKMLAEKLRPFLTHVKTEDVLDLPPVMYLTKTVPMTGDLKRMYQQLDAEMIAEFGADYLVGDNRLVCELRLHELTGGHATPMRIDMLGRYVKAAAVPTAVPDDSADAKINGLLEEIDELGGEPFVVFVRFKADAAKIKAALEDRKMTVMQLTGSIKQNDEFEAGQGDCLIANIQAGNAGIRLTRARFVFDYTIGNSRTDYVQSRYRFLANGLDKSKPIVYTALVMENSVDEQIFARMQKKEGSSIDLLAEVLAGGTQLVSSSGDIDPEAEATLLRLAGF